MKNYYTMSMKILTIYFLMKFGFADAQLTIINVGENYNVGGVSNNGIVSFQKFGNGTIYKWTVDSGIVQIGALSSGNMISGNALISTNGSVISSSQTNPVTGFEEISTYDMATSTWTNRGALVPAAAGGSESCSWGMSPDGNTVVGLGYIAAGPSEAHAIKWNQASGLVDLGSMVPGRSSRANAVNADGSVVVGWQDEPMGIRRGTKWVDGVETFITDNSGNNVREAQGVSADGSTIIGTGDPNPYVWTAATGMTYITHPNASFFFSGGATGISGDGKKVIGYYRQFGGMPMDGEGFIWTRDGGRVNLNEYVESLGISTNGITLGLPTAISQDGTKIAGTGLDTSYNIVTFYLDLSQYLSVKDPVKNQNDKGIYPNPVNDILYFKGTGKIEKAEIYNMVGQKIKSFDSVEGQINVSSLLKGNYILRYSVKGGGQESYKFIKK